MKKWYLDRDPLVTAELIIRNNRFEGWTHKDIMKLIHIHSDDPSNLKIRITLNNLSINCLF